MVDAAAVTISIIFAVVIINTTTIAYYPTVASNIITIITINPTTIAIINGVITITTIMIIVLPQQNFHFITVPNYV